MMFITEAGVRDVNSNPSCAYILVGVSPYGSTINVYEQNLIGFGSK